MEVCRMNPSELNSLLDLYQHLHKDEAPLPDTSTVEAIWQELQSNPRYQYFGVYVADKLICSCTITVVPNLTRGCKPYALIVRLLFQDADTPDKGLSRLQVYALQPTPRFVGNFVSNEQARQAADALIKSR